ncbi:RluA family pseudouridine synthase [Jatrophihabitans fulvus]
MSRLLGYSRTAAADLIDAGHVTVDGAPAARSAKVHAGSLLGVDEPSAVPAAPPTPVDGLIVLHEDDDVVVVAKPVGVAAHPSPGWTGPTVTSGLAAMGYRLAESGAAERQGIVHRLDVGTTGAMVVARSERAYSLLKRAFKERTVDKRYSALVQGHPDPSRGTIDAPIGRHPGSDYKFAVVAGGRPSVTHYETEEAFRAASLLDVHLETGRTHQIRVHMAAVKHPCVGDLTYGADPTLAARLGLHRQWLHARELAFEHPGTGTELRVVAPLPDDLAHALDVLRDEQ